MAGGSRASAGVGGKRSAQAFLHSRGCLWLPFLLAQCQPVFSQSLPFPHLLDEDRDRMSEATWRCDRRGRPAHLMSPKVSSWPWTPPSVLSGQPASLPPPGSVGARCSPACPNFPCKDPRGTRLPFRGKRGRKAIMIRTAQTLYQFSSGHALQWSGPTTLHPHSESSYCNQTSGYHVSRYR